MQMLKLVDSHCHIEDEEFDKDREKVILKAKRSGVIAVITSSLSYKDVLKSLKICNKYNEYIYLTVGFDPTIINEEESNRIQNLARKLASKGRIIGLGEVGLDYYWVKGEDREIQKRIFISWIELAEKLKLPLVVHSRSAGKYAIQLLLEYGYDRILMHAFDGRSSWALKGANAGFKFSIPTSVWYSRQKQKLVKALPLECMLVESDSPVLSPVKGERNEPSNLIYAVKKIAEIKNLSIEEVAEITTENAVKFFYLEV